jgi:hypothetical protein
MMRVPSSLNKAIIGGGMAQSLRTSLAAQVVGWRRSVRSRPDE